MWTSSRLSLDDGWEGAGLVPSAFARRRADGATLHGYRALSCDPAAWETFPDWKRQLLVDGDDAAVDRIRPLLAAFLQGLGDAAREVTGRAWPSVLVTVPVLAGARARRGRDELLAVARAAFPEADSVHLTDEPSAAYRGATMGHVNARAPGRMLIKDPGGLWGALNAAARGLRADPAYRVLVADLGSLTLDLALLRFDLDREDPDDRLVARVERCDSVLLGLDEGVDGPARATVSRLVGAPPPPRRGPEWTRIRNRLLDELSREGRRSRALAREREAFRRAGVSDAWVASSLFAASCDPWPAPIRVGGVEFGTREQWTEVTAAAVQHAQRISDALCAVRPRPDYVLLTGGGFRAARLRTEVVRSTQESGLRCVRDIDYLERVWGEERRGLDLARFGTAFGAANVLAQSIA